MGSGIQVGAELRFRANCPGRAVGDGIPGPAVGRMLHICRLVARHKKMK